MSFQAQCVTAPLIRASHANSVDKTPEGDYLYSARHCDTIYKISGKDGSIIWRLGGVKSDFPKEGEMVFSRQHDIRYRGQNATHLLVSMLDNAKGIDSQPPTWDFSRGLLIAIDEKNRKATVERHYDYPYGSGGYAPRRGNYQLLPNGNVFMGWSERAVQSEHTPDGELVWEAVLQSDWLGAYRNYKFDGFVGRPVEPPVAHSRAYGADHATTTVVHVSWNGATEVVTWNMYRTSADGETKLLAATADKLGFETVLSYGGYASFIVIDAINKKGEIIGKTDVVKTYTDTNVTAEAVAEEEHWLEDLNKSKATMMSKAKSIFINPITAFFVGCICCLVMLFVGWKVRQQGVLRRYFRSGQRYTQVSQGSSDAEVPLRATHREKPIPKSG